jgi:hypothetical protein
MHVTAFQGGRYRWAPERRDAERVGLLEDRAEVSGSGSPEPELLYERATRVARGEQSPTPPRAA